MMILIGFYINYDPKRIKNGQKRSKMIENNQKLVLASNLIVFDSFSDNLGPRIFGKLKTKIQNMIMLRFEPQTRMSTTSLKGW